MNLIDLSAFVLASSILILIVAAKTNNKKSKVRVKAQRNK